MRCAGALLSALAIMATSATVANAAPVTVFSAGVTQGSRPQAIASGPDRNLWFTAQDRIGRLNPFTGHVDEFTAGITPNSISVFDESGITSAPDGNLWFTEPSRPGIAFITPSGTVTELPALPGGEHPSSITTGPDGNVWFCNENKTVGRVNLSTHTINEFPLASGPGPEGITSGPDGNLWVTESESTANTHIARVTPSGTVTDFPNLGVSSLGFITAGTDGNLWFTETRNNAIGRISTSGMTATFSSGLSPTTEGPEAITTASDRNVWFTEGDKGPAVGRILPNGTITEFPHGLDLTKTVPADGLTSGADGNLWFPVQSVGTGGVDGIARFTLPSPPVLPVATGPTLSGVHLTSTSVTAKKGTKLALHLSAPAKVKVVITRKVRGRKVKGRCKPKAKHGKRCTLTRRVRTLTFNGKAGANLFKLRLKGLKPGRYKLTVHAIGSNGIASRTVTLSFKIKKPRKRR